MKMIRKPRNKLDTEDTGTGSVSVFSSCDFQQTTDVRYIEVYRGHCPTLEFEDDNLESLERPLDRYGPSRISLFLGAWSQTKKE